MLGHRPATSFMTEHPRRLEAISPDALAKSVPGLVRPTVDEYGEEWISRVHSEEYISFLESAFGKGIRSLDSAPTYLCHDSYAVARVAVHAVLTGVDEVYQDRVDNAFCAVRPPGHHANRHRGFAFCLLNNVAIAARYLQKRYRLRRVMIVDWDVHPGNGTMEIFYDDPTVLTVSLHQDDLMPAAGLADLRGAGDGVGTTVNVPLPASTAPEAYCACFEDTVESAAAAFRPDAVLISAGFDTHVADPIGGMRLQDHHYVTLTQSVLAVADRYCGGKLMSVLEGGYNPEILLRTVTHHCLALRRPRPH